MKSLKKVEHKRLKKACAPKSWSKYTTIVHSWVVKRGLGVDQSSIKVVKFENPNLGIQWGSEHQPFEYRKHLNIKLFEMIEMVWYSNGQSMGYFPCTSPTI